MATVSGGIFGGISGKVGNVIFRKRGSKIFVAKLPKKRESIRNAREIENGKKFGLTGKISKEINSIKLLKYFWHHLAIKGRSVSNVIFKENFGLLNIENLSGRVIMSPNPGFGIINPSLYVGESNLVIECKALGESGAFDTQVEKYVSVAGIIVLKNPSVEGLAEYDIIAFQSKKYLLYPTDYMSLSHDFSGDTLQKFESYSVKKAFAVFVTMDEEESPVQHSVTFSNED
jgi:hypothetical protein